MGRTSRWCKELVAQIREEVADGQRLEGSLLYRLCPATKGLSEDQRRYCTVCDPTSCHDLAAKGIGDDGYSLPKHSRPECGARTRSGLPCKTKVIPGKKRCRLHGGLSTGPKTELGRNRIAEAQRLRHALASPQQAGEHRGDDVCDEQHKHCLNHAGIRISRSAFGKTTEQSMFVAETSKEI